jgi:mannonate dehydratase
MWRLAVQLGVTDAVTGLPQQLPGGTFVWDFSSLLHLKQRFADAGLTLSVIESSPPMNLIRLGLPGRDEEIEQVCQLLTNMGAVGIRVWKASEDPFRAFSRHPGNSDSFRGNVPR